MVWLLAASGTMAAVTLVLRPPRPETRLEELAAAGWSPAGVTAAAWIASTVVAIGAAAATAAAAGGGAGATVGVMGLVWLPRLAPALMRAVILAGYRQRRDMMALAWLRRIRLLAAAGRQIDAAAVSAAAEITDPGFDTAKSEINRALSAGRDPLAAISAQLAGSPAETLVTTLAEAKRSGAGATELIDGLLDRSVRSLEAARRARFTALGRSVMVTANLITVVVSVMILAGVMLTLPSV